MNVPYVKEIDVNGSIINKVSKYVSEYPNRRTRKIKDDKFVKNSKGCHLSVTNVKNKPNYAFKRVKQLVDGKVIEHYIPKTR